MVKTVGGIMAFDKSKLKLPDKPKLRVDDLCQGKNTQSDTKDLQTWIDTFFEDRDTRIYVERQLALKIGILAHSLIRWSDEVSKKIIVKVFNQVMNEIYESV